MDLETFFLDLVQEKGIMNMINNYKTIFETFEKKQILNNQFKKKYNYLHLNSKHSLMVSNKKIKYYYYCDCCTDKDVYIHNLDIKSKKLTKYDICLHNCEGGFQKVDVVYNSFEPFHNFLDNPIFIEVLEYHLELFERGIESQELIRLLRDRIFMYL